MDIKRILRTLDIKKATGPDGISALALRYLELSFQIARLLSFSFKTSCFPSMWKHANVTPVPKKGDLSLDTNYRPISLLPILSKVMEIVVNNCLRQYLEDNKLLFSSQYGFRLGRSSADALICLTQQWEDALDRRSDVLAVTLDIRKAFDRVWHRGLIHKLSSFGISGLLSAWISSFLSDRSQSVILDGFTSSSKSINSGVPQGSVLGTTLFLLFINDYTSKS